MTMSRTSIPHRALGGNTTTPTVTQIIQSHQSATAFYTAEAAQRGTDIHRLCEDDCHLGDVIFAHDFEDVYAPYVAAWRAFKTETTFFPKYIERRLTSDIRGHPFSGCPDRVGHFNGDQFPSIVDIKSGAPQDSHRLQLAGYAILVHQCLHAHMPIYRYCVHLQATGRYKLIQYPIASLLEDQEAFQRMVIQYYAYYANLKDKGK